MEGCDAPRRKTIDVEELPISMSTLGIEYGDYDDDDDKMMMMVMMTAMMMMTIIMRSSLSACQSKVR